MISILWTSIFANQRQEAEQKLGMILSNPPSGIERGVWENAVTSQLSQCANGDGGDCKCALVVSQGIQGDIYSATMWIGTFARGEQTTLWTGYASRKASADQNRTSVNMPTNRCKRRNGVATVTGNRACVPGRQCRDASVYRALIAELGLPPTVALTSFYFSTPMQNETYKFHDFYGCRSPRCPATLGCLGLERHAMKDLCLRHMGSDGSNGINEPERGGVWLYFHNVGSPGMRGSRQAAVQGFENMMTGRVCGQTSTAQLGDGSSYVNPGDYAASGEGEDYSSGGDSVGSAMQVMQGFGNGSYQPSEAPQGAETPEQKEAQAAYIEEVINACEQTVSEACPNVESNVIRDYCANQRSYKRGSCEFEKVGEE